MVRIGTERVLKDDERQKLLDALSYWHRQVTEDPSLVQRGEFEMAFECVWPGQNSKGVRMNTPDSEAFPFEGASDQRLRWGEKIFLDQRALIMLAFASCEVEITCGGDTASIERARALKMLLNGVMNSLGAKGFGQILAMIRYMLVDTPAVAAMDVGWRKTSTIGVKTATVDELAAEFAAQMELQGMARFDGEQMFRAAVEAGGDEFVENWLVEKKGLFRRDLKAALKGLSEDGEIEYRAVVEHEEGAELKALRYGDDFCIPTITDDFDYASPWFRGEWVTESQLKERIASSDWDAEWVRKTLEFKGHDLFNEQGATDPDDVKDLCNIVWCYTAETDDEGRTTRYMTVISLAEGSAFGKRILKSRRGKWNTVFFRREVRGVNILNSRGIAQLSAPVQGTAKVVRDGAANNAIVGSLPPIKAKGSRVRNVLFEPFAVIPMGVNDDAAFMQPPAYPAAAKETEQKLHDELLDYMGVSNGETDVTERRQEFINWIIIQWRDLLVQLLEIAQDNASDTFLARATVSGDLKGVRMEDVSGPFQIAVKLDPTNLDNEKVMKKVQAVSQLVQSLDRNNTVDTDPLIRRTVSMLFPEMAGATLRSAEELTGLEVEKEQENFVKIKAGVMPKMDTDGKWNYAARLQFYNDLQQQNPDAISEMSPASQQMLQQWMAALQQQQTQYGENAQIGRTGVEGVGSR